AAPPYEAKQPTGAAEEAPQLRKRRRGEAGPRARGKEDPYQRLPWIRRYAPQRNLGELGISAGVFIPSERHDLYNPKSAPPEPFWRTGADIAVRAGFYPLRSLGIEAEFNAMPTRIRSITNDPVFVYGFQAHVVFQLPFYSVVPFFLAGGGLLGVRSASLVLLGKDVDPAVHYGAGVKINLHPVVGLRFEARNILSATELLQNSATTNVQVLGGLTFTLGRKPPPEPVKPPPPKDPDIDKDGIFNEIDECPSEPGMAPHGCPDIDGDSFIDKKDACREVPGVAPDGCPVKDTDKDSFLDPDDDCVFEPETWNGLDDGDGCPDDLPPEFSGTIAGIDFDFNKDTIRATSKPVLDKAVAVLKEFPDVRVKIVGHTDDVGTPEFNADLSRRRAEAVKKYMTDAGVDPSRIETEGRGALEPVGPNDTEANRAKNRRIDFEVIQRKAPDSPSTNTVRKPAGEGDPAIDPAIDPAPGPVGPTVPVEVGPKSTPPK
ncbi:MAG: OmpA family protein, partial [Myxococcales bacterium]|nr:OmpA family protein [Myxococcales bacterium]